MKKFTTFAYMMAIALVSTAGFTSCKNEDEVGEGNYNGETVKTQFAIALPGQLKGGNGVKRMPGATAQVDGASEFQGITSIMLVPFAKQDTVLGTDTRLGNNIQLIGDVTSSDLVSESPVKVYSNVSIPLNTASFLFYAKSRATGTGTSSQKKFMAGSLIPSDTTSSNQPADFKFDLEQIQPNVSVLTSSASVGGKLMEYLTHIAIASDGAELPLVAKRWYEYTAGDNAALHAMFETYTSMTGVSSFKVARVLTDLNKSLKPLVATNALAAAIVDSIKSTTFSSIANVNATTGVVTLKGQYNNYPGIYHLPDGTISMKWDGSTHKFTVGDYPNMATPDKYVYPAQLWYFVDSKVKTSNTSKQTMYDGTNDWATVLAAHTDAASVNSLTRAVAIVHPVQYAVARLDVQVRLKLSDMEDNSLTVEGARTDVDCSAGFPVTAVLVGGQQQVKFDFTANTEATEYTIYDSVMASKAEETPAPMMAMPGSTYSAMNHTLVLENGTGDVQVAIEMENTTGVDFYGAGGQLIPAGGKFYVVAKLESDDATETGGHVFKQDFVTTAKLTLKDLKSAYNTIPDLRTPQLELGFSVDLTWQDGHEYEIEF